MFQNDKYLWDVIFQFPTNTENPAEIFGESLVWRKYAPSEADVHAKGHERESSRRATKPNVRYIGFVQSTAGRIREIKNQRGHKFAVAHRPQEGMHHAEVSFVQAPGLELKKSDKSELKVLLRAVFSALIPDTRAA